MKIEAFCPFFPLSICKQKLIKTSRNRNVVVVIGTGLEARAMGGANVKLGI